MKVIRGGTVVTASDAGPADVLIDGESIAAVGASGAVGAEVVDATGCHVLPGAVDNHTHLSMPFMGHVVLRRLRHGHAGGGGRRRHVPRRLRDPARARQPRRRSRSGRAAPTAPRTSTTASTWRSPTPTRPTIDDMERDGRGGRHDLQGLHGLQGRADGRATTSSCACWSAPATPAALTMVHAENGDVVDLLVHAARWPPGRPSRSTTRSRAPSSSRPRRPAAPCGWRSTPARRFHRPRDLRAPPRRRSSPAARAASTRWARRASQYLAQHDRRPLPARPGRLRGRAATSARPRCATAPTTAVHVGRDPARPSSRSSPPTTARSTTSRSGSGSATSAKIPNGLALIQHRVNLLWEHGVREGRLTPSRAVELLSTAPRARLRAHRTRARSRRARTPTSRSSTRTASTSSRRRPR